MAVARLHPRSDWTSHLVLRQMSLEYDNWGDARAKASDMLFDSLRQRPTSGQDRAALRPAVWARGGREVWGLHDHAGARKRKRHDGPDLEPRSNRQHAASAVVDLTSSDEAPEPLPIPGVAQPRQILAPPSSQPTWAPNSYRYGLSSCFATRGYLPGADYLGPFPSADHVTTSAPLPESCAASQGNVVYAVKVGWFPGIYPTKTEANKQTMNYPHKEQQTFPSREAAQEWLAQPSLKTRQDAPTRPERLGAVDKVAFMRFVADSWAKCNETAGVNTKDIMQKLKLLFKQACEDEHNDVSWKLQHLPQLLVSRERDVAKLQKADIVPLGLWSGALQPRNRMVRSFVGQQAGQSLGQAASQSSGDALNISAAIPFPLRVCSCRKAVTNSEEAVTCAGEQCKFGTFHKACVGLGSRRVTAGWRCWQCRPKPPPGSAAPSSSQAPRSSPLPPSSQMPSSRQAPSSPPTTTIVTRTAPLPVTRGEPEPPLHPEQAKVVDCIMEGGNVFYTGSAGTGKSTVLKSFVQRMKDQGKQVDIVAPSGIAALNVGGMTVFAYAGWHPDSFKEPLREFVRKSHGKNVRKRLCRTDVLVIDEISMVERDLLVRLDTMMREVRMGWKAERGEKRMSKHNHRLPFGGAQVVITGDFCQLPPVKPFKFCMDCGGDELPGHAMQDGRPLTCKRCRRVYEDKDKWAFRSDTWRACAFTCFELRHIHRQSDKGFIDILQRCRYGQPLLPAHQAALLTPKADPIGAVKLLPRRSEVNAENARNFNGLQSRQRIYESLDCFMWRNKDEPELQAKGIVRYSDRPDGPLRALQDHRFEEQVRLKEGMLVILLVNLDFKTGLVNGSQGKIIGFEKHAEHKVFPPQAPDSPRKGGRGKDSAPKPEHTAIKEDQIRQFIDRNDVTQWPVIEFHNGVIQPIYAHCQLSELGSEKPYSLLGRTQMPLLAAWAITVHKSQGMTLNRVIVDLHTSFEREMVYVALSRARSLEGLKVLRLARNMDQGVNDEVQQFLSEHGLGGCR